MKIIDKITMLMEKQKIGQQEFCDKLGIKSQTMTDWKAGRSQSYNKYISDIAKILNVSSDFLLGKTCLLYTSRCV